MFMIIKVLLVVWDTPDCIVSAHISMYCSCFGVECGLNYEG